MFSAIFPHLALGLGHFRTQPSLFPQVTMKQIFLNLKIVCLVKPDFEKYRKLIADSGMTREQEDIFLRAAWQFCEGIIDREFGLHPAQQVEMTQVQKFASDDSDLVESDDKNTA